MICVTAAEREDAGGQAGCNGLESEILKGQGNENDKVRDLPGDPVAKTPHSQSGGPD